jgi:hypothetical protein
MKKTAEAASNDPLSPGWHVNPRLTDITAVVAFLANVPPDDRYGGSKASEALETFARLIDVPVAKLRGLA